MSELVPEKSNFIVIGAWNPAIIQPGWLLKHFKDLIPNECKIEVSTNPTGGISSIRVKYDKVTIIPGNGRLLFIPEKVDIETLEYISKLGTGIKKKLEHTPVSASGCNFIYRLSENEIFALEELENNISFYEKNDILGDLSKKKVTHTLASEDYSINLNYGIEGQSRELAINFDYQRPDSMKFALEALVENFNKAEDLKEKLIKEH